MIWDLDNTLWEGILGEQDPYQINLRPGVRETMLALDARGILQSVASKNDHDDAWRVQQELIQHLERIWDQPDEGLWEVRGPRRHFTYSR